MWQLDLVLLILYTIGTILIYKPAIVGLNISGSENYNNHKTIDLMSEGRFSDALGYSEKAYNDLKNKKNTSPILFLLYLYNNTQSVIDKNKSELYDATFNYAACLEENGIEVDKAAALFEKCIIEGPQFGLEKAIYIETSAYVLLKIYINKGDKWQAENLLSGLISAFSSNSSAGSVFAVNSLLLYAYYLENFGDFDRASEIRKQVLVILGENTDVYLYNKLLLKICNDYITENNVIEAEKFFNKIQVKKAADDPLYEEYLITQARLFEQTNDMDGAEQKFQEYIEKISARLGENNNKYVSALFSLASFYFKTSKEHQAKELIDKSLGIASKLKEVKIELFYNILLASALSDFLCKDLEKSVYKLSLIEHFYTNQINKYYFFLTEEEKESFISTFEKRYDIINSIYVSIGDSLRLCKLYDNILAIKSAALQSNQYLRNYILKSENKKLVSDYKSILKQK